MLNIPNESLQDYVQHIGSLGTLVPGCHLLSSVPCILPSIMVYRSMEIEDKKGTSDAYLTSFLTSAYCIRGSFHLIRTLLLV